MAQLDHFIKMMLSRTGSEVRLVSDSEPVIVQGTQQQALIPRKLTAQNVRNLVGEIAPEASKRRLMESDAATFSYAVAGHDAIQVDVRGWGGAPVAVLRPAPPVSFFGVTSGPGLTGATETQVARAPAPAAPSNQAPQAPPQPATPLHAAAEATGGANLMPAIFQAMVKMGSSDLHLSSSEKPMVRKDGDMLRLEQFSVLDGKGIEEMVLPLMTDRARAQFEETSDADFAYEIEGLARFRGNVFADRKGTGAVFRTIPTEIITAEQLGLSHAIQNLCFLSKGLVLVTGPTGSGKSTTLCALVDLINRKRSDHIITIEDPIEFVHPNKSCLVNQREVGEHTESFKRALRAALREDPDIVLVGEMRDLETIAIAVETAETGHLVFGTLHTSTAPSTVDRIIDQFPADRQPQIRVMLSESLKGVISQTLCKKIGGGRVAALEVLLVNSAVSNLIREGKTFQIPSIMQTQRKVGMVQLNDALLELVQAKKVELKEAYTKAVDKTGFTAIARQAGLNFDFLSPPAPTTPGGGAPTPATQ